MRLRRGGARDDHAHLRPRDAGAIARRRRRVAAAHRASCATGAGIDVEIIRTGSRGLFWLEPLVEVETATGRIAYGPVTADATCRLCSMPAVRATAPHPLRLGRTEEIPCSLKRQTRLTFARCGVIDPRLRRRLPRAWRLRAWSARSTLAPGEIVAGSHASGPARPRRRRLPDRHQVEDGARSQRRPQIRRLQRRRRRQRHLRRPHDHGGRSLRPDRGHDDRRRRRRRHQGLHLHPLGISACGRRR